MMAVDLLSTLEDLTREDFKSFKWHLQQPDILEGYQAIKKYKLEDAKRRDTVDLMINTYQSDGALKVTKKILEKINRNDLVQRLPDTGSGPRVSVDAIDVGKTSERRGTSSSKREDHKTHDVVPPKGFEKKKAELKAEIDSMIEDSEKKIQDIKHSDKLNYKDADREKQNGIQVFTALTESVQRGLNKLTDTIEEKRKKRKITTTVFIKELEQEICELKKKRTEVEQLSRSEDHLHLLHSVQSLKAAPPTKDWTQVSIHPPSYEGTVVRAVSQLEETLSQQMKKLVAESELKRVQHYAVDVTLDPHTAHPELILSDDGKQVNHVEKNLPGNPERCFFCVLGKQSFSSGRFYFEVQVKGKTGWTLGVVRESINRKANITLSPRNGFWTLWLINGKTYQALADPSVCLPLKSPLQKVGVFVDYDEGLVSFYDVDAAALIYSFTGCSFTEKLFPFFNPCHNNGDKNSAPLIISSV